MRRQRVTATVLALGLVAGACSTTLGVHSHDASRLTEVTTTSGALSTVSTSVADTTPGGSTASVPTPSLHWVNCGNDLDCASMAAPLDYSNPSLGSVTIKITRHRALQPSGRIGSLLVNPGGPGFGGQYLAQQAENIYSQSLLDHFDIIGWDPRGTGESVPAVDCISNYDQYFSLDVEPTTPAGLQALVDSAKSFAAACQANNGALLAHISTLDSARDMDLLRRALGEAKISYFGFSYGSQLGATWATLFPSTVKAAVLDGASDPNASAMQGTIDQAKGFETALNAFLADCAHKCTFAHGADPGATLDALLAAIHSHHYPTVAHRPTLNLTIAYTAIVDALYAQSSWPDLDAALTQAESGQGADLLALYDDYYQRQPDGTYGNELEAFIAISCLDDPGPGTVAGVDAYNSAIVAVARRLGPSFLHGYSCVFWPVPGAPKVTITGKGAGPILVIGTTNDPATPYDSSHRMAQALEHGIFVTVVGNGHTGYTQSSCARDVVDRYLVQDQVPTSDVTCQPGGV